jgi:hypothetical protein
VEKRGFVKGVKVENSKSDECPIRQLMRMPKDACDLCGKKTQALFIPWTLGYLPGKVVCDPCMKQAIREEDAARVLAEEKAKDADPYRY